MSCGDIAHVTIRTVHFLRIVGNLHLAAPAGAVRQDGTWWYRFGYPGGDSNGLPPAGGQLVGLSCPTVGGSEYVSGWCPINIIINIIKTIKRQTILYTIVNFLLWVTWQVTTHTKNLCQPPIVGYLTSNHSHKKPMSTIYCGLPDK